MDKQTENFLAGSLTSPVTQLIVAIVLVGAYVGADALFVRCSFGNCSKVDSRNFSSVANANSCVLNRDGQNLKTKETALENKEQLVSKKQSEVTDAAIKVAPVEPPAPIPAPPGFPATPGASKGQLELEKLMKERGQISGEINGLRTQISSRYSNRVIWTFLTALFFLLSSGAIVVSLAIIAGIMMPLHPRSWWLWCLATLIIAAGFAVFAYFCDDQYMSIVLPTYKQSFGASRDLSLNLVNFFNVYGFAATILLIFASSAILGAVNRATTPAAKWAYTPYIKAILYIGGMMLFVGMLRMRLMYEWHVLFFSPDVAKPLAEFFKSLLSVHAGFYTIILALIYLPVAYAIPVVPTATATEPTLLQRLGLPVGGDFIPKLITVIGPFLAGPLVDLFEHVFGKTVS